MEGEGCAEVEVLSTKTSQISFYGSPTMFKACFYCLGFNLFPEAQNRIWCSRQIKYDGETYIISYHISYISIEGRRRQGLANPHLSREVVGGVDGGDHAVDGEEGGEVGRVRGDQDQREEPPYPTLASTRVLFVLNYYSDEDLG